MEFLLGCNYWASNAGTEMWRQFDEAVIEQDLKQLSRHGVTHLRVFPIWRDFQPVEPQIAGGGRVAGYTAGVTADDVYYLDRVMLDRFSTFLDICDRYQIRVVVGLITGWMSGGLFIPPALYGKNILTDPLSLSLQQLFIQGFVTHFCRRDAIIAWDLGNECNCMGAVSSRFEAMHWTATVSNAIRAADPTRPIVSGMHGLDITGNWTIRDQAQFTDMLTTHPYPFWCEHTHIDETCSLRTTMHPTAQTKYYAELGGKPCLAEEIGTMGPMVCSDQKSADFLRVNLFSLWANGAAGVMWWCANDQTNLHTFPYTVQMVEQELGMLDVRHQPKPVLTELKRFADFLHDSNLALSDARTDAVCVLTRNQDHWGVAYMTHILSRLAGLNCRFADGDEELPSSDLYLMPSVNSIEVMPKHRYEQLKERIAQGTDLYLSLDNAVFSEFEALSGLRVVDSYEYPETGTATVDGCALRFSRRRQLVTEPTTAQVLVYDDRNRPFISVNHYGKGRVFVVAAPIEQNLIGAHNAFDQPMQVVYRKLLSDHVPNEVRLSDPELVATYHPTEDGMIAVIVNHHDTDKPFTLQTDYTVSQVYYGSTDIVKAYDACVIRLTQ